MTNQKEPKHRKVQGAHVTAFPSLVNSQITRSGPSIGSLRLMHRVHLTTSASHSSLPLYLAFTPARSSMSAQPIEPDEAITDEEEVEIYGLMRAMARADSGEEAEQRDGR